MNKVMMIGRLTKDAEVKVTNGGKSVASATLAVDRTFKQDGQPTADFFNLQVWGKTAEVLAKYCSKGSKICVVGRLQNRTWEQDGQKRYATEIVVDEVEFLDSKKSGQAEGQQEGFYPQQDNDDELPF